ncbi:snoRNA-binding rRNA-processing protein utp10 [Malassezia sp. CBS 17886]|nr:snoRNA-binding rRNA-processing protein utp10 [Malassezia sp. CBS 17886]
MTTSLAAQLAALPSHNAARLSSSSALTARDSYLFTPRVAAEQDHVTVHALGVTGWEHLADDDAVLARWRGGELLFGEKSVHTDRTVLPQAENDAIDAAVREFLWLVGPMLLSRSAAKCIEWLVRRFRIQAFTPRALLRAFLPYHATPQFARILQLVPLEPLPELHFLAAVKKAQMPLPTPVLIHALGGNLDLLRWVAQRAAPPGLAGLPVADRMNVRFWTSILVQFCLCYEHGVGRFRGTAGARGLRRKAGRDAGNAQAVLAVLVPAAVHVLDTAAGDKEALVGALMVLSTLGATFPLSAAAVRDMLAHTTALLAEPHAAEVARAAVACCFALCASPEDARDPLLPDTSDAQRLIPGHTLELLLALPEFRAQVVRALQVHDVDEFVAQLLGALAAHLALPNASELLSALLVAPSLSASLARRACERLVAAPRDAAPGAWAARIRLLAALRQRLPALLDAALDAVRAGGADAHAWTVLAAVLQCQATGDVPEDASSHAQDTALWLGLQSADDATKRLALEHLMAAVITKQIRASDPLVRDAVAAVLRDPSVPLLQTLYVHPAVLLAAWTPEELLHAVVACMGRTDRLPAKELKVHLRFLTESLVPYAPALSGAVWRDALWPHLFATSDTPKVAGAVAAALGALAKDALPHSAPGSLGAFARAIPASALAALETDAATYVLGVADAIVGEMKALGNADLVEQADFLLRRAEAEPVSRGGALALLTLSQLLAQPLPPTVWVAIAYRATTVVHAQQLLAGQPDDVILRDSVDVAVVREVHDRLSRRSVRLLGMQLQYVILHHAPVARDASLFIEVQQRSSPAAQLLVHLFQTLHGPGAGHSAAQTLAPVLYARVGKNAFALLAGLWTPSAPLQPAPGASGDLARLISALERGGHVPPSDVAVRLTAMRHATLLLRTAVARAAPLDLQTLLPSLLVVLQEPTPVLRDAAAQLLRALHALSEATPLDAPRDIYGYDCVYGRAASGPLQYLDAATLARYTGLLVRDAGAFINDASFLAAAHATALGGSGKKETLFRTRILCYLMSHVVCWDALPERAALLAVAGGVSAACKLTTLLPLVTAAVAHPVAVDVDSLYAVYLDLLFAAMDASAAPVLEDRSTGAWAAFLAALGSDAKFGLQTAALHTLRGGLLPALSPSLRQEAFLTLAQTLADQYTTCVPDASVCLRTLPVSDAVLISVLRTLCEAMTAPTRDDEPASKRTRGAGGDEKVQRAAVVLITVLESIQSRTLGMSAALVAALFDVVRAAIELHGTPLFNCEYLLQLAMQSLCNLFDHVTILPADVAQVVRADVIVQAIKASSNTQSINHAILLLTRFARLDAELVLHNIMPLFTFVGLTVLQRDDRFTLSVVEQTLRSIIPAFVNSVRPQVVNDPDARLALWIETRSLLRIFSDASSHIPRHRRHVFFRLLVDVLGADDFLAPVCMLLIDRVVYRVTKAPANADTLLQLPLSILRAEPPRLRLRAMNQIWSEIVRLLARAAGADDVATVFLEQAAKREYSDEHVSPVRQALALVLFLQHAIHLPGDADADADADDTADVTEAQRVFAWHTLRTVPSDAHFAAALDRTRAPAFRALPLPACLDIVLVLLRGQRTAPGMPDALPAQLPAAQLQATGIALLKMRLARASPEQRAATTAQRAAVNEALVRLWQKLGDKGEAAGALEALRMGIAADTAADDTSLAGLLPMLLSCDPACAQPDVLVILAVMVEKLGVRVLAHLATLVPFGVTAALRGEDDQVVAAGLSLLTTLVRTLPQFMHAHVEQLVRTLCDADTIHRLRAKRAAPARADHNALRRGYRHLQDAIVKRMPAGTVLDAVQAGWDETPTSAKATLVALLSVLQQTVREMDRASVAAQYKPVFRFLLRTMDLQRGGDEPLSSVVERSIHAFVALALRLSESQFRPLFLRMYDWAAVDLLEGGADDADRIAARTLVLYSLMNTLLAQLHGMVTSYYAVLLDNVASTLRGFAKTHTSGTPLWYAVVLSTRLCAQADEGSFLNTARATRLVGPLVAQLPHLPAHDDAARDAFSRAVLALADAVPDDDFLRTLNSALMTHANTPNVALRVNTLTLCAALWDAHGVPLLAFVPETVAALSELLDDTNPRTSAAALRLRGAIEKALGEPLDSYLE